jgi:hypothetical protein
MNKNERKLWNAARKQAIANHDENPNTTADRYVHAHRRRTAFLASRGFLAQEKRLLDALK